MTHPPSAGAPAPGGRQSGSRHPVREAAMPGPARDGCSPLRGLWNTLHGTAERDIDVVSLLVAHVTAATILETAEHATPALDELWTTAIHPGDEGPVFSGDRRGRASGLVRHCFGASAASHVLASARDMDGAMVLLCIPLAAPGVRLCDVEASQTRPGVLDVVLCDVETDALLPPPAPLLGFLDTANQWITMAAMQAAMARLLASLAQGQGALDAGLRPALKRLGHSLELSEQAIADAVTQVEAAGTGLVVPDATPVRGALLASVHAMLELCRAAAPAVHDTAELQQLRCLRSMAWLFANQRHPGACVAPARAPDGHPTFASETSR